jgi:signal transduction histidine kinase/PleD family two-component response regulator/HPt (histidine-containing phosphotransfer) domain-containing protein
MTTDTMTQTASPASGDATFDERRVHPIVRLNYLVRLIACPFSILVVIVARIGSGAEMPLGLWIALGLYATVWPHVAFLIARRSREAAVESRIVMFDAAATGAEVALVSFQLVPTLGVVTGALTTLASIGGGRLLVRGLGALLVGTLTAALTFTGFAVVDQESALARGLSAALLVTFQVILGLLTYRTARRFTQSRRRIAEQAEEIRAQNEALMKAREEALQAAQAKAAFLATMSHEIRTPLNGVIGMTRLLAETPLNEEQSDFVRTIQVSGTTLLTVINDILDYSRIESGRLELEQEPLQIREVVEDALEIVAERARERGIELICDIDRAVPESVVGDVTRLRQVLTNLAGNAVKFTHQGEVAVVVRLRSREADLTEIEFSIRDSGIGIPADRIPVLFVPFTQADTSTTRRYGGTGLGLAISRRLTELMGGSIAVESVVGEGSTFTFTIRAALPAARPSLSPPLLGRIAGQSVLVVDDNATNRRVLSAQLNGWGLEPAMAADAEEALGLLASDRQFALAIIDLQMPEVDGLMLARRIQEIPGGSELPLILLSSSFVQKKDDPEQLFRARLMKPVRESKLLDSILQILAGKVVRATETNRDADLAVIAASASLNVLVADDNDINRKLAGLVLRRLGCSPEFAVNGRDAVDQVVSRVAGAGAFDLVFMDVHMPEMDGLEATRRLRQLEASERGKRWPRIVAMTANAMPEDREICLAAGMNDYLTKPLEFDAVRSVLERVTNLVVSRATIGESAGSTVEDAAPQPSLVQSTGVMDWSRIEELRTYDTPDGMIVKGAITSFMDQAATKLEILREDVSARNGEALRASAHALKGAALNIGATAVADCAQRLELAGKHALFEDVDAAVENLATAIIRTVAELRDAQ